MLTDKAIRAAKPREKLYRMSDGARNGLCLEVSPAGSKRWRYRYRLNGKESMISLGIYPDVTLEQARDLAHEARRKVKAGIAPGEAKKAEMARGEVFADVARAWFDGKFAPESTEKYAAETWARIERDILPHIGALPLADIDAPKVLAMLRRLEAVGKIVTMYKCKSHVSQIFRYAIASGKAFMDPSRDLAGALRPRPAGHYASIKSPADARRLMCAIRAMGRVRLAGG